MEVSLSPGLFPPLQAPDDETTTMLKWSDTQSRLNRMLSLASAHQQCFLLASSSQHNKSQPASIIPQQGHSSNQFIGPNTGSTLHPGLTADKLDMATKYMAFRAMEQRPFECVYCDKRFKSKNNLRQHVRIHTGERPYVCNICAESFIQMSSLQHHRAKKHNTK